MSACSPIHELGYNSVEPDLAPLGRCSTLWGALPEEDSDGTVPESYRLVLVASGYRYHGWVVGESDA